MSTPLSASEFAQVPDATLVERSLCGERTALEALLRRHQGWVFNLALYQLQSRAEAEDATQEILLKALTGLSGFRGGSAFRTWLNRIAINHLLDRRRSGPEQAVKGFDCYGDYLDAARDEEMDVSGDPQRALLVEEARHACVLGMLLCLDRPQRLTFILGELLELDDAAGAELLELTRDNFRQRLARARQHLAGFMRGRCGLIDPENPCRCARKTAAFLRDGIVEPSRLQFAPHALEAAQRAVPGALHALGDLASRGSRSPKELYARFAAPDVVAGLGSLLQAPAARADLPQGKDRTR